MNQHPASETTYEAWTMIQMLDAADGSPGDVILFDTGVTDTGL